MSVHHVLMIIAAVCFFLAAVPVPFGNRIQLGWLGLFFWSLTLIIGR